jgi:peptide/nickel transport system permease protein
MNLLSRLSRAVWAFARDYKLGALGGALVLLFLAVALLAPQLAPYDPDTISLRGSLAGPSARHWLGQDLLSRIIFGARMSLYISLSAIGIGAVFGVLLGMLAAYYRRLDMPIMRLMDVVLAFPGIIVALTTIAILGRSVNNVVIAIGIYHIPQFARLVHGLTLSIQETVYVEGAVASGESDVSVLTRYILPNCLASIVVQTSLLIPGAIMTAATLSFLGLGVPPPTAEWGSMLQNSLQWAQMAPHVMIIPGLALMLAVFGFNVLGDELRDAMDPRLKKR